MAQGSASPQGSSPAQSGLSAQRREVLAQLDSPGAAALPPPGWHRAMPTCHAYLPGCTQLAPCVSAAFAPGHELDGSSSSPSLAQVTSAQSGARALPGVPSRETVNTLSRVRRPLASPTCPTRSTSYVNSTKWLHLCPAIMGTNPSPLSPAPRCRGHDHVHHVRTTTGTPGATAGGHPPYPGCCPPCAPPLCPKGGNGAPLASACPSDCPQQGTCACLSTPGPPPVLWARHGGDTGSRCVHVASLPAPSPCPGGPAPVLVPWQMGQGSPLANGVGYHIPVPRDGSHAVPQEAHYAPGRASTRLEHQGLPSPRLSLLPALVSPGTVCP